MKLRPGELRRGFELSSHGCEENLKIPWSVGFYGCVPQIKGGYDLIILKKNLKEIYGICSVST